MGVERIGRDPTNEIFDGQAIYEKPRRNRRFVPRRDNVNRW